MSQDLGDRDINDTLYFGFNTHKADGTPITLAGTPAISIYKDDNTTEVTTGVTLTVDFDSRTGYHMVKVVCTDAFYATTCSYKAVITAGTVDSISVVGMEVAHWTINKNSKSGISLAADQAVNATKWAGGDIPTPNQTGIPLVDFKYVLGSILTEGASGRLKAAIVKFFNVATPVSTCGDVDQTGDSFAKLGTPAGASIAADLAEIEGETDGIPTVEAIRTEMDSNSTQLADIKGKIVNTWVPP
jgi:hypothetical protein